MYSDFPIIAAPSFEAKSNNRSFLCQFKPDSSLMILVSFTFVKIRSKTFLFTIFYLINQLMLTVTDTSCCPEMIGVALGLVAAGAVGNDSFCKNG